jgi:hypothetical protein
MDVRYTMNCNYYIIYLKGFEEYLTLGDIGSMNIRAANKFVKINLYPCGWTLGIL